MYGAIFLEIEKHLAMTSGPCLFMRTRFSTGGARGSFHCFVYTQNMSEFVKYFDQYFENLALC